MVSALKKDGERLYDLARRGVEVEREPRQVVIGELEILDVSAGSNPLVSFRVVCGKGTYVRSLADDLARALGGRAHLVALRRTRNGPMHVDDALPLARIDEWAGHLIDPARALAFLPSVDVDDASARLVADGRPIELEPGSGPVVVLGAGRLLAVYRNDGGIGRPEVVVA